MKSVGILGVAPWSTFDFLKIFYDKFDVKKDWEYPRLIVDINTQIPSRGRYFDLNEKNPSAEIKTAIENLLNQNVYRCAVICNTAHILFDEWGAGFDERVVNLLYEVGKNINLLNVNRFSVIGSSYVNKFKTYANYTDASFVALEAEEQGVVSEMINTIKMGKSVDLHQIKILEKIVYRRSKEGVGLFVIGCTELSFLSDVLKCQGINVLDSNQVLADVLYSSIVDS